MIVRYYSVKDALAGEFMNPQAIQNDEVAKRSLKIIAQEKDKYYKENWQDIELHYLFSMDTESGEVVVNTPYCVGRLFDYVKNIQGDLLDGENN